MRVLVATGRPDLGDALSLFLRERRIHVLDVVDDADEVLARTRSGRPDVVLVDWSLGEALSTRMVADLMQGDDPPTPVIILSTSQDRARAKACGAAACATLGDHPDSLVAALHEVGPAA
jgi:DNA-binding response OmpR family regulator